MTTSELAAYRQLANLEASEVSMALRKTLDEIERMRGLVYRWTRDEPAVSLYPGMVARSGKNEFNKGDLVVACKCGFARAADKACMECK